MVSEKTSMVFGSTGGIGSAICNALLKRGYRVGGFARRERGVLDQKNPLYFSWSGDALISDHVQEFVEKFVANFGSPNVVVFSIGGPAAQPVCADLVQYQEALNQNLFTFVNVMRVCAAYLSPGSRVIVIGSKRADTLGPNRAPYCASKAALVAVVGCFRQEYPEFCTTLISPGYVDTPFYGDSSVQPYRNGVPVLVTSPEDIAKAVEFICSLSDGATIDELRIGDVLGEQGGIEWKPRV